MYGNVRDVYVLRVWLKEKNAKRNNPGPGSTSSPWLPSEATKPAPTRGIPGNHTIAWCVASYFIHSFLSTLKHMLHIDNVFK